MRPEYVIESVTHPGSFWSDQHKAFKGWLYAAKYPNPEYQIFQYSLLNASFEEPCKIVEIYDNSSNGA